MQAGFHGITTVAELKPTCYDPAQIDSEGFHGITTVAELKQPVPVAEYSSATLVSTASQPWPN